LNTKMLMNVCVCIHELCQFSLAKLSNRDVTSLQEWNNSVKGSPFIYIAVYVVGGLRDRVSNSSVSNSLFHLTFGRVIMRNYWVVSWLRKVAIFSSSASWYTSYFFLHGIFTSISEPMTAGCPLVWVDGTETVSSTWLDFACRNCCDGPVCRDADFFFADGVGFRGPAAAEIPFEVSLSF